MDSQLRTWLLLLAVTVVTAPSLLAQSAPDLLVSGRNNNAILRYDGDTGDFVEFATIPADGGLSAPQEVIIHADGDLIVTGRFNNALLRFGAESTEFISAFTTGYTLAQPTKTAYGPDGNIYVSQWGGTNQPIARFDGITGVFIDEFTSTTLNLAMGQAWDDEGRLYVANFGSRDVHRFDTDGTFIDIFADTNLNGPVNLWFDSDGSLLVQDWTAGSIKRFDGDTGEYLGVYIGGLVRTEGFAYGTDGLLYIADWQTNVVNRYNPETGALVDTFIDDDKLATPNGLLFMPTTVSNESDLATSTVELGQSYPNPAADVAMIRYTLKQDSPATLRVFDLVGREVATLVDGFRPAGTHTVTFERGDLPAGLYVYRLTVGNHTESRRLILAR